MNEIGGYQQEHEATFGAGTLRPALPYEPKGVLRAALARRQSPTPARPRQPVLRLTEREQQAFELRSSGLLWKQVAHELGISTGCAATHYGRAVRKLKAA